jgi:hypothetical protein
LRIFAIVGTLITVVIIAVMAVMYLNAATAPMTNVPEVKTPYGTVGGQSNPANVIDTARGIASMDRERQQDMQNIMNRIDGAGASP